ncbi:hypothetical protein GX51_07354 [Blastomyces parvus]|uniref:Uncharacterized protein n=1 Tax=Blastomyces parvus TaxID=2060905 RepID=A0A2B7WL65_9EURO|nr:hypothetical protein GX51_07354 [Blastomyces parvus]
MPKQRALIPTDNIETVTLGEDFTAFPTFLLEPTSSG